MRCIFQETETLGDGKSKRDAKRDCSHKMLIKLDELKIIDLKVIKSFDPYRQNDPTKSPDDETNSHHQVTTIEERPKKKSNHKSKSKNIVVENKINPDYGLGSINPISRLIQIQQAKKLSEPVYELLEDKFRFHKHEFTMQVSIGTSDADKCTGTGTSKRMAKHNAAENMLISLGYLKISQPKPALKSSSSLSVANNNDSNAKSASLLDKKVKFAETIEDNNLKSNSVLTLIFFNQCSNLICSY
jgi:hypothetical protein